MRARSRPAMRAGPPSGAAASRTDAPAPSLERVGRFLAAIFVLCALAAFPASALFDLRTVTVRGNAAVPASEILRRAGIAPGESAFRINTSRIREGVLRDPRIQDVSVAMEFPRRVTIVVRERTPVAALRLADAYAYLAADGVVIARAASPSYLLLEVEQVELPSVQTGTVVPSADVRLGASVAGMLPPRLRGKVLAVRITAGSEAVLRMRDGVAVRLGGERGLADRLRALPDILTAVGARGQRVEYVDVRFLGNVIVRPLAASGPQPVSAPSAGGSLGPPAGSARPSGQQENPGGR